MAIVFVHVFTGTVARTWGQASHSWPELVVSDDRFEGVGIFLCDYESKLNSGTYGFEEATRQVMTQLEVAPPSAPRVTDCDTILFVGHSAGGIVSRNVLVKNIWAFRGKKVGLALVGSPSKGSGWADFGCTLRTALGTLPIVGPLLRSAGGKQLGQLTTTSSFLLALDAKFQFMIDNQFLTIVGREFVEHKAKFVGAPLIVGANSAAAYYSAESVTIASSDHSSICRPESKEAQAHQELVRLWMQLVVTSSKEDEAFRQDRSKLQNEADLGLFRELSLILSLEDSTRWLEWIPGTPYHDAWLEPMWGFQRRSMQPDCFFHDEALQSAQQHHLERLVAFTTAIARENEALPHNRGQIGKGGKGIRSSTNERFDLYDGLSRELPRPRTVGRSPITITLRPPSVG